MPGGSHIVNPAWIPELYRNSGPYVNNRTVLGVGKRSIRWEIESKLPGGSAVTGTASFAVGTELHLDAGFGKTRRLRDGLETVAA